MRSLARSLVIHESIETTEAKAKELRTYVEKLVTRSRVDTVANRRLVMSRVPDAAMVKKLFTAIGPRYKDRKGGYLRIVKKSLRGKSDGSKRAYIAFV